MCAPIVAVDAQQHPFGALLEDAGAVVGGAPAGVADHVGAGVLDHHLAMLVVQVDDGRGFGGEAVEEEFLAAEVLREGAMVVEVVVGEVGEDRCAELQTGDALLLHADRAHLHEAVLAAGLDHFGEQGVERHGIGGGVGGLAAARADVVGDGREQAALEAEVAEHVVEEGDGGRLAVRARNAHELEFAARVAVERIRGHRDGPAAVLDCHDRQRASRCACGLPSILASRWRGNRIRRHESCCG